MNGMMFGGEGPVMQGTWYNPHTGDAFTVRDSFFEDNQFIVTTTDGRYLNYNQLQNYIQSDMKLEDLKKMKEEKQNTVKEEIPAEVASLIEGSNDDAYAGMMTPDDLMIGNIKPNLGNLYRDDLPIQQTPVGNAYVDTYYADKGKGQSMNEAIIEKALKNAEKPEFNVDVIWDNFPLKQIEMLKDIMEIPEDEIIDWYLDNIEMMEVVDALKTAIRSKILNNQLIETEKQIIEVSNNIVNTIVGEIKMTNKSVEEPTALADSGRVEKKQTTVKTTPKKTNKKSVKK